MTPAATRSGPLYRAVLGLARFLARHIFRFRLELQGAEHLPRDEQGRPAGGWIAAGLPHRRWIDPFLLVMLLPAEPRVVFFGDGRAIYRSPLRRLLFRLLGGVVPIWPGGGVRAFGRHVEGARQVIAGGAVFALFPEAGPPSDPGRARRVEPGIGYLALRTGAPIVPLAIGGNDELYRGRRLVLRVLPAVSPTELAGGAIPAEGTADERRAARRVAAELHRRTEAAVASVHARVDLTSMDEPRRWRWLSDWIS
ncbi:MAG: lysophospholipid acyltransferase family protein [Candidatus Limnocylindria bacterium]